MAISERFLDELRDRIPVSTVVGRTVKLAKAGREYKGLCPFHNEKTPSFHVIDDKGFYHCFGCGAHGDIISFLIDHDKLSFPEAVAQLAEQAGLDMPKPTAQAQRQELRHKGLYDLAEATAALFQRRLASPDGRAARSYLASRQVSAEAIGRFRLGYAPADGQALVLELTAAGFGLDQLLELGLARTPDDGRKPYAFFRNRLMFPVTDRRGRVVAFGARLLQGDGPKYINSPESPIFHKGRLLYNLAAARDAARGDQTPVVVEGYLDVIALDEAGFGAAVAPLGTALTEAQVEEVWRLAPVPVLCFDGDTAGKRAAARAAERILPILKPAHSARIAFLPPGEDPDSLIRSGQAQTVRQTLDAARPLDQAVWETLLESHDTATPEGKAGLGAALRATARTIADPIVRDFYDRALKERMDAAFPAWPRRQRAGGGGAAGRAGRRPDPRVSDRQADVGGAIPQPPVPRGLAGAGTRELRIALALAVNHPSLLPEMDEALAGAEIRDPGLARVRETVLHCWTAAEAVDRAVLADHLRDAGLQDVLAALTGAEMIRTETAADPARPVEDARAAWHRLLAWTQRREVERELRAAAEACARDPSQRNLDRMLAIRAQAAELAAIGAVSEP